MKGAGWYLVLDVFVFLQLESRVQAPGAAFLLLPNEIIRLIAAQTGERFCPASNDISMTSFYVVGTSAKIMGEFFYSHSNIF